MSSPINEEAKIRDEAATGAGNPGLRRELARLDELLAGNENWQALRQLDEREARGELLEAAPALNLRRILEHQLAPNPVFRAHRKIEEALAILEGTDGKVAPGDAAARPAPDNGAAAPAPSAFRTQVKIKPRPQADPPLETGTADQPATKAPAASELAQAPLAKVPPEQAQPEQARPEQARPEKAPPDKAKPDKAKPDKAKPSVRSRAVDAASSPRQTDPGIAGLVQIAAWRYQDVMRSREMAAPTHITVPRSAMPESDFDRGAAEPVAAGAPEAPAGPDAAVAVDPPLQLPFGIKAPAPEPVGPVVEPAVEPVVEPAVEPVAAASTNIEIAADKPVADPISGGRLTAIKGIDEPLAARLECAGFTATGQISRWSAADVAAADQKLELGGRISRENWIEQAAMLDEGVATAFASRVTAGDFDCLVAPPHPAENRPADDSLSRAPAGAEAPPARAVLEPLTVPVIVPEADKRASGQVPAAIATIAGVAAITAAASSSARHMGGMPVPDGPAPQPPAPSPGAAASAASAPTMPVPTMPVPTMPHPAKSVPSDYTGDFLSQPFVAETVPRPVGHRETAAEGALQIAEHTVSAFAPPRRLSQAVMEARADTMWDEGKPPVALELPAAPVADMLADPAPERQPDSASQTPAVAGAVDSFMGPDIGEADVKIVSRGAKPKIDSPENRAHAPGGIAAPGNDGPVGDAHDSRNETHAAYHSQADEASVVIVKRDAGQDRPDLPLYKQSENWRPEGKISRFLKALTGD